jgi:hypothetical protein
MGQPLRGGDQGMLVEHGTLVALARGVLAPCHST